MKTFWEEDMSVLYRRLGMCGFTPSEKTGKTSQASWGRMVFFFFVNLKNCAVFTYMYNKN